MSRNKFPMITLNSLAHQALVSLVTSLPPGCNDPFPFSAKVTPQALSGGAN